MVLWQEKDFSCWVTLWFGVSWECSIQAVLGGLHIDPAVCDCPLILFAVSILDLMAWGMMNLSSLVVVFWVDPIWGLIGDLNESCCQEEAL